VSNRGGFRPCGNRPPGGNLATSADVTLAFNRGAYRAEAVVVTKRFSSEGQLSMRQERMLGVAMLVAGLAIAGLSMTQMRPDGVVHAQAAPQRDDPPAESMPGGTRPTTPAPEPARPQSIPQGNEGSTTGSSPAGASPPATGTPLPPAPAEKTGRPIQPK
jgi:hypothetical protein